MRKTWMPAGTAVVVAAGRARPARSRRVAALAVVAMVGVSSAGCGNGSPGTGTAGAPARTGSSSSDSTGAGHKSAATNREKAVRFAECMQANGVPDFPDPKAAGDFPAFGVSVNPAAWDRALLACEALKPPTSLSARLRRPQQSAALKFARCMRGNGVSDFPDPVNDEPLVDTRRIPSSATEGGMSIFNAAIQKCRGFVGG